MRETVYEKPLESSFEQWGRGCLQSVKNLHKLLKNNPQEAINGTTAVHTIALVKGANILRVHDVKEAKEAVTIWNAINNGMKLK